MSRRMHSIPDYLKVRNSTKNDKFIGVFVMWCPREGSLFCSGGKTARKQAEWLWSLKCGKMSHTDKKVPTIQERQHQWQQCVLQRWERIVSGGLSYKAGDLSRSSGGWEDDIALVWKVDDPAPPSMTAQIHTHTHTHINWFSFIRCPSILPSSPSVILKPFTKACGLISSSPHQACKDLDPTQREMR